MKRLNPTTGLPFIYGFVREDGYVFKQYLKKLKRNGYFSEQWLSPVAFNNYNTNKYNWQKINFDKTRKMARIWYANNTEKVRKTQKKWQKENADKANAYTAKRRSCQLQRTPPWLTADHLAEIQAFYTQSKALTQSTGVAYHVDHIIPLQGKTVSGLHVPWNLQVITATENCSKSNRLIDAESQPQTQCFESLCTA